MPNPEKVQVGTLVLTEPKKVTQHYETARWYTIIEAPPGEYPIYRTVWYGTPHYHISYTGPVIDNDHTPLFGGCAIGKSRSDVGKTQTVNVSITEEYANQLIGG